MVGIKVKRNLLRQMVDAITDNLWYYHLQILVLEKKFRLRIFIFTMLMM